MICEYEDIEMIMAYHRVRGLVYQGTRSDYESIYKRVRKYNKK